MKLIDAAKVKEKMKEAFNIPMSVLVDVFAEIPTVDTRPVVYANWIDRGDCHKCSNCGAVLEEDFAWYYHQFCYHCGARMIGVERE